MKSIIHGMTTTLIAFLKSILVSAVIAGCKQFLFSKLPDWDDPEKVRQWILMNLPTLVKIAASTKITWDDLIVKKLQAIVNDPVAFEIIYRAITDVNTTPIETEAVKQTLRERIKARLGYTLSESAYVEAANEIIPLINAIKNIKQLARA